QRELAATLRSLAAEGPEWFYRGDFARRLDRFMQAEGGLITSEDLAAYKPEWQAPIDVTYRGLTVKTCPPNNQGFQIRQTLKLLEGHHLAALGHNSTNYIHLVSEAVKLAVADRIRWAGDPRFAPVPLDTLFSDRYIAERARLINHERASRSEGER